MTIIERIINFHLAIHIDSKTTNGVAVVIRQLYEKFRGNFHYVFLCITTHNGSEFPAFSTFESLGRELYDAHPYSSWERPTNERANRILSRFLPKGKSISKYSAEQELMFLDQIHSTPRKILDYHTPEKLLKKVG